MGWSKIKLDQADKIFSLYIRIRDGACARCGRVGRPNKDGQDVIGLQCSHYWSRRNESVRFDSENCDALCAGCHRHWGGDYRREYEEFKRNQLGDEGYNLLEVRKNTYQKKDRKMSLIVAKELLKEVT